MRVKKICPAGAEEKRRGVCTLKKDEASGHFEFAKHDINANPLLTAEAVAKIKK